MAQPQDGADMMPGAERRGMLSPDGSYNTAQNYPAREKTRNNVPISKPSTEHATSNQDDAFMKGNDAVTSLCYKSASMVIWHFTNNT